MIFYKEKYIIHSSVFQNISFTIQSSWTDKTVEFSTFYTEDLSTTKNVPRHISAVFHCMWYCLHFKLIILINCILIVMIIINGSGRTWLKSRGVTHLFFTQFMVRRPESIAILIVGSIFYRQKSQLIKSLKTQSIKKEKEEVRRYRSIYKEITVTTFSNRATISAKQV